MLERQWAAGVHAAWREADASQDFISFADIVSFARQYASSILSCLVLGILCAVFYSYTSNSVYSARTQILIEPKIPQNLQQERPADVNLSLDTAQVESQIAVLRSQKVAMMVIESLGLMSNPTFNDLHGPTFLERIRRAWVGLSHATGFDAYPFYDTATKFFSKNFAWLSRNDTMDHDSSFEQERRTVETFGEGLDVQRVGVSYAIDISFQSLDATLAASIANATADAFVREQVETREAAAGEGIRWLERRMREVGDQMNEATRVAQEFRAKHDYRVDQEQDKPGEGEEALPGAEHKTTLEQLEATASTYQKMYESLLGAYTNSVDQQPYLIANARVITYATRPITESQPRKKLILAFGALAGLIAGIGIAAARRSLDRNLRTAHQIRRGLGLNCIGELPPVAFRRGGFGRLDEVLRAPRSAFADGLRSVKATVGLAEATLKQPKRCIGVTSVSPGDGKSTVVSNLAILYGASGVPTLVINADEDSAMAKEFLDPADLHEFDHESGNPETLFNYVKYIKRGSFYCLNNKVSDPRNLLLPKNVKLFLKALAGYELVIVELPSFTTGADGLAICPHLDGVIVVAQWGETSLDQLADLAQNLAATKSSILGVLMTCARSTSARRYRRRAVQAAR